MICKMSLLSLLVRLLSQQMLLLMLLLLKKMLLDYLNKQNDKSIPDEVYEYSVKVVVVVEAEVVEYSV